MTLRRVPKSKTAIERARELRRNMTQPERALWRLLRDRWLAVLKFRRQQPVGDYIVDFFCEARTWSSSLAATAMTIAARMIVDGNNGLSRGITDHADIK